MIGKQRLVVVGNGMAGARAVEEVIARGGAGRFDIVMYGDEPYGNYNRILLSNVLSGAQDTAEIFLNALGWYEENGIRLHAGHRVTEINRAARKVHAAGGPSESYDKLLIATGSRAFVPPIKGAFDADGRPRPGVLAFRTLDDTNAMMEAAKRSRRAAVIGGGLLGLEAARGPMTHGCEVHVVHLGRHLMGQQLDAPAGGILCAMMEAVGVKVNLEKATTQGDRMNGL